MGGTCFNVKGLHTPFQWTSMKTWVMDSFIYKNLFEMKLYFSGTFKQNFFRWRDEEVFRTKFLQEPCVENVPFKNMTYV